MLNDITTPEIMVSQNSNMNANIQLERFVPQLLSLPTRAAYQLTIRILILNITNEDALPLIPTLKVSPRYTKKRSGWLIIMRDRQDVLLSDISGRLVTGPIRTRSVKVPNIRNNFEKGLQCIIK